VDNFTHFINSLLQVLIELGHALVGILISIELWVRSQLQQFGLAPNVQTAIMVGVAAVLILASLKLFGGLIRVALVLILILIALHILLPVLPH
jgi:hypothetical protein